MDRYFADAPLPVPHRWLGRIQRMFAAIYASAAQAIDYGILPWGKEETLAAIGSCMNDAMKHLIGSFCAEASTSSAITETDASLVAQFKRHVAGATFVALNKQSRTKTSFTTRLKKAAGITRSNKNGNVERFLFSHTLDAWFPDVTTRKRLTKVLRTHKIFGKGRRSDTTTQQVFIRELGGKTSCYALSRKRLRRYCEAKS